MRSVLLSLIFVSSLSGSAFASFIISHRAVVYAMPDFNSKVIAQVRRGEAATVLELLETWTKVRVDGHSGWVKRMSLTEKPYIQKIAPLKDGGKKFKKKRRRIRQRVARAAVGVKGLRESQVSKLVESQLNFEQLKKMESFTVREDEAYRFLMGQPGL